MIDVYLNNEEEEEEGVEGRRREWGKEDGRKRRGEDGEKEEK